MPTSANQPTQPLALSATYLAMLQARPAAPQPRLPAAGNTDQPPSFAGRGRLLDILV